jgi:hypothetical protein
MSCSSDSPRGGAIGEAVLASIVPAGSAHQISTAAADGGPC